MILLIKIAVAVVLIALLLAGVDWQETSAIVGAVRWWALAVVLAAMIFELLLSAWKWSWSLRMHGLEFKLDSFFEPSRPAFS